MTVSTPTAIVTYTGTGSLATYQIPIRFLQASDLVVTVTTPAGVVSTLALTTDYTITGAGLYAGGTITLVAGNLTTNYVIVIFRNPSAVQTTSLQNQGSYNATAVETALDLLTMQNDAQTTIDSTCLRGQLSDGTNMQLPSAAQRVSKFLSFDLSGNVSVTASPVAGTTLLAASLILQTASIATLRLFVLPAAGYLVRTQGYTTANDGGGGTFIWSASDVRADNGGSIIQVTGIATGRWNLIQEIDRVNVRQFGAKGDGATDDSAAVTLAIAWLVASTVALTGSLTAQGAAPVLYFPAGVYVITNKKIINPASVMVGFSVVGAGRYDTKIIFNRSSVEADNYLIYNNNLFGYCEFRDIYFQAKNQTEYLYFATAGSNVADVRFVNCYFDNFAKGFDIQGTTLASEHQWDNCTGYTPASGFMLSLNNPQSVDHWVRSCSFSGSGTIFQVLAGGCIEVSGGSFTVQNSGNLISVVGGGASIGTSNGTFNMRGAHIELLNDASQLFTMNASADLVFDGCNIETVINAGLSNKGALTLGRVIFTRSQLSAILRFTATSSGTLTSSLIFDRCKLEAQVATMVTITSGGTYTAYPHVEAFGCTASNSPLVQGVAPIDVRMNAEQGWSNVPCVKKQFIYVGGFTNTTTTGLPASNAGGGAGVYNPQTVTLPIGATLTKITLIFNGDANFPAATFTFQVNNNGATIVWLGPIAALGSGTIYVESGSLWYKATNATTAQVIIQGKSSVVESVTGGWTNGLAILEYI